MFIKPQHIIHVYITSTQDTENGYTYINMNAYKVNVLHVQCRCMYMYRQGNSLHEQGLMQYTVLTKNI